MIEDAEVGKVFIINGPSLKELGDRRCYVCNQQVNIGDVIVRVATYKGARAFHAHCFRKRKHQVKIERRNR